MSKLGRIITKGLEKIRKDPLKIVIVLSIIYPLFLSLNNILNASIPFWFDPARDFLLALDNLSKPTLIGQPTGIPGVFYGPYWIWAISLVLKISKDPRLVAAIILLLPYFTIFPYVLFKFSKIYGLKICLFLWVLFIFSSQAYTTFLWNPHLAPLLFLILVYLTVNFPSGELNNFEYLKILVAGIISGLILNTHMSFGLGVIGATIIFFVLTTLFNVLENRTHIFRFILKRAIYILVFITGLLSTLVPYFVFELRHNFLQSRSLLKTITDAVFYNSASVGQTGLKPQEILQQFFLIKPTGILSLRTEQIVAIYLLVIGLFVYMYVRKKLSFSRDEKNLLLYLLLCSAVLLELFLSSKNPVWDYHFIGTEIIFILLIGLVARKLNFVERGLSFWSVILILVSLLSFISSFNNGPYSVSSLATKKYIVEGIYNDVGKLPFAVYAYSPAIYTYDYDYILKWLGEDVYHQLPEEGALKADIIYLIIPKTSEATQADFIYSKTPEQRYQTLNKWVIPDGTTVIKRGRL